MRKIVLGIFLSVTMLFAWPWGGGGGSGSSSLIVDNTPTSSWFGDKNCENEESKYETIQDAVDDAQDGDTIKICDGTYDEAVTVDNGKNNLTIEKSADASDDVIVKNDHIVFKVDAIDGLTIDSIRIEQTSNKAAISINSYSKNLLFKNLYIESDDADGIETNGENGKFEIQNSIIEAGDDGIDFNANINDGVKISNTEINAKDKGITADGEINGGITLSDVNITTTNGHGLEFRDNINDGLSVQSSIIKAQSYGINTKASINSGLTIDSTQIISKNESLEIEKDVNGGVSITNTSLDSEDDAIDFSGKINDGLTISDSNITAAINGLEIDDEINGGVSILNNTIVAGAKGFELNEINGDVTISDVIIIADSNGIEFNGKINSGINISSCEINATSARGIYFVNDVYNYCNIDDVVINSYDRGIYFNSKEIAPVITNSNITSLDSDGIYTKNDNGSKFTLKDSCVKTQKSDSYALWINNSSRNAEVTGNCFYATAVDKLAKAKKTGNDIDSNNWDGLTDAIYDYNRVKDNNPLLSCPISCDESSSSSPTPLIDYYMDECSWDNDSNTHEIKNFGTLGNDYNASAINNANTIDDGQIYRAGDINSSSTDDKAILAKTDYSLPDEYTMTTWIKFPLNTDGHTQFRIGSRRNRKIVEYFNIADRVESENDYIYFTYNLTDNTWSLSVNDDDDTDTINFNPQDLSGWHMLTFIVTDDGTDFYLDKNRNNTFDTHPNTKQLGLLFNSDYSNSTNNEVNGQSIGADVDEFQIFNQTLNSTQIETLYDYDGSDRAAPQCGGTQPPILRNYQFDARDTFRDIDDKNISTEIVGQTFQLTLMSLDENDSEQDFNGTVCSRVESTDGYFGDYNKTIWSDDKEKNASFMVDRAIGGDINATLYIKWFKNNSNAECSSSVDSNDTNATDNFAVRPKDFNISDYPATIYAGADFTISFKARDINDINATDYNESNGDSFTINVSEMKSGCVIGTYSGDVTFSDGGNTTAANYSEIGNIDINISDENLSCNDRFSGIDCKDKNITNYWNSDTNTSIGSSTVNIRVQPYELNITKLDLNVSTQDDWLYMADNINDMNITLFTTLKAFNKQGDLLKDFNSTCYAQDVNVTFYYDVESADYDVNLTLDGNLTSSDVNISDINKTLQIPKELFISGEANSSYAFGIDRDFNVYKNPKHVKLKEANITTPAIAKYENNISMDRNATFYYGRTYPQDLSTSKEDDNTTVEILVYADSTHKGFVNGLKEELLDWYLYTSHTENDGNISDSNISTSTLKSDSVESTDFNTTIPINSEGTFTIHVHNHNKKTGTHYIHLGEDRWLWYVPKNFGSDYNYSNGSDCSEHPCVKYNYEQNDNSNSGVTSGDTTGVYFDVNISKNSKGVRLLR